MGIEALLAVLVGAFALIGISSGGSDDDSNDDNSPIDDPIEDDGIDEVEPRAVLSGTSDADELLGDELINDIDGQAGDDFIVSFGADGTIDGGDGDDTIVANTGSVTLTGGEGEDVFFVMGDEDSGSPTDAFITDFDAEEDALILTFQQSEVANGDVVGSPDTVFLNREEIETDNGVATKLTFGPQAGFEDTTQGIGFSTVTLDGVSLAEFENSNVLAGIDTSPTDDDTLELVDALDAAVRDYDGFTLGTSESEELTSSQGGNPDGENAVFGLGGDDILTFTDEQTDLFGGSGDDVLNAGFNAGNHFGGDGDDVLRTETNATLTGGEGADEFNVLRDIEEPAPTIITDFVVGEDTLRIDALLFGLEGEPEEVGDVTLEDIVMNGVSGTLVTTSFEDIEGSIGFGPSVFLIGVAAADIPDGTFTFNPSIF